VDELLTEQELSFTPLAAPFDAERAGAAVLAMDYALRDEFVPSLYLLFLDAAQRERHRLARHADPRARLPCVLLIDVRPECIHVNQFAGPEHDAQSRQFLGWLAAQGWACEVHNEDGRDLSGVWRAMQASSG
jgi:hypothetical protein